MTTVTRPSSSSLGRTERVRRLPCGCVVAIYQTRSGEAIEIIDTCHPTCSSPAHALDVVITTVST